MEDTRPLEQRLPLGSDVIEFSLPGTDGQSHSPAEMADKKALLVVFSCNHCPYVMAWEDRMIAIGDRYPDVGMIAINANETVGHPTDSMEHMVERVALKGFTFPYLRDDSQDVAKAYHAVVTPEFFLYDGNRKLAYHGRLDDNHENPNAVEHTYLADAIDALLAGGQVPDAETNARGCSIKWHMN